MLKMKKLIIACISITFMATNTQAQNLGQKENELQKIYKAGGITTTKVWSIKLRTTKKIGMNHEEINIYTNL